MKKKTKMVALQEANTTLLRMILPMGYHTTNALFLPEIKWVLWVCIDCDFRESSVAGTKKQTGPVAYYLLFHSQMLKIIILQKFKLLSGEESYSLQRLILQITRKEWEIV